MEFGSNDAASKGGRARAKALTVADRREIGRLGAERRWNRSTPRALIEAILPVGGIEFECAVLDDKAKTRVLSERAFSRAIGAKRGGSHWQRIKHDSAGAKLPVFLSAKNLRPFISNELAVALSEPIVYITQHGNRAHGTKAELIPQVLDVWLKARERGVLTVRQQVFARVAEIVMRGLATTGIIALIDDVTGFRDWQTRGYLARVLEAYIAKELRQWISTFPTSFFREICRLRGVSFSDNMRLPRYFGHIVNDLVYNRLAPAVRRQLERKNPVVEGGRRKHKHFQWLTEDVGHPKLLHHLGVVEGVALGYRDGDWDGFYARVNRMFTNYHGLPLFEQPPEGDELLSPIPDPEDDPATESARLGGPLPTAQPAI